MRNSISIQDLRGSLLVATTISVLGGFGIAVYLSYAKAMGTGIALTYHSLMQLHGHLQLFGWVGIFIAAISLHILPRMMSRPLLGVGQFVLPCMVSGALIRSVSVILLASEGGGVGGNSLLHWSLFGGSLLESAGLFVYAIVVVGMCVQRRKGDSSVKRVIPYLLLMSVGAALCGAVNQHNAALVFSRDTVLSSPSERIFLIDAYIYLIILPAALLFSVKLLPIFMGLREPRWPVGGIGWVLALASGMKVLVFSGTLLRAPIPDYLLTVADLLLWGSILSFIWCLDILTRRHVPERLAPLIASGTLRGRGVYPDRGEYGRFEWHIYAAYVWLTFVAGGGIVSSLFPVFTHDLVRHMLLLGFVANLILGVGYRLLPSLLAYSANARQLPSASAIVLNLACGMRLIPLFGSSFSYGSEGVGFISRVTFGMSGSVALVAAVLFGVSIFAGCWKRMAEKKMGGVVHESFY